MTTFEKCVSLLLPARKKMLFYFLELFQNSKMSFNSFFLQAIFDIYAQPLSGTNGHVYCEAWTLQCRGGGTLTVREFARQQHRRCAI